jgi:hypothetical protein
MRKLAFHILARALRLQHDTDRIAYLPALTIMIRDEEHIRSGQGRNVTRALPWNVTQALAIRAEMRWEEPGQSKFVAKRRFEPGKKKWK